MHAPSATACQPDGESKWHSSSSIRCRAAQADQTERLGSACRNTGGLLSFRIATVTRETPAVPCGGKDSRARHVADCLTSVCNEEHVVFALVAVLMFC